MSWVRDTRRQQEDAKTARQRRDAKINDLASLFFEELCLDVQRDVKEINAEYAHVFDSRSNSQLTFRDERPSGFRVTCGPSGVVEVERMYGTPGLRVTRRIPTGTPGRSRFETQHYIYQLDGQENLYAETKDGRDVPCEDMSKELLAFIPNSLDE
jgi:hypothetical protein